MLAYLKSSNQRRYYVGAGGKCPPDSLIVPSRIQKLAERSDVISEVPKCSKIQIFRGSMHYRVGNCTNDRFQLEEAAQGKPSAKYRPSRLVVDAALPRIGKSRHGGHKIATISGYCQRISPMDSVHFSGSSGGKKNIPKFFLFSKFGSTLTPCSG